MIRDGRSPTQTFVRVPSPESAPRIKSARPATATGGVSNRFPAGAAGKTYKGRSQEFTRGRRIF